MDPGKKKDMLKFDETIKITVSIVVNTNARRKNVDSNGGSEEADDEEYYTTPKGIEHRIPKPSVCPPRPSPKRPRFYFPDDQTELNKTKKTTTSADEREIADFLSQIFSKEKLNNDTVKKTEELGPLTPPKN